MNTLVVTNPFGGREAGERITDPQEIESILAGEHAHHVVRAHHADAAITSGVAFTSQPSIIAVEPEIDETIPEEA